MKKIILIALAGILFGGCYTQIGTIKEDEGYSTSQSEKEYRDYSNYNYDYNYDAWYYSRYIYRYYLPYPRYSLFFRYYTPGFAIGWGEWSSLSFLVDLFSVAALNLVLVFPNFHHLILGQPLVLTAF